MHTFVIVKDTTLTYMAYDVKHNEENVVGIVPTTGHTIAGNIRYYDGKIEGMT